MNLTRYLAPLVALVTALPVSAAPISVQCRFQGHEGKYGPLTLTVDLERGSVLIQAAKAPGIVWRYQDGVTGSYLVGGPPGLSKYFPPVRQFVRVTDKAVTVGWLSVDDPRVHHVARFNLSALGRPASPCIYRRVAARSRADRVADLLRNVD